MVLHFDEEYFRDEVRCDFLVPEMMKRVWAAELKVLSTIIEICKKHNITYYADWGTLLGAVRHKGFVPWDDDMDIALKRADYMKLLEVLPKELPGHYHISSLYTPGDHKQPIACVMNSAKLPVKDEVRQEFYDVPYIVGIDIYVLDYLPRDAEDAQLQLDICTAVYDFAHRYPEYEKRGEAEAYLQEVEEMCAVKLERNQFIRKQLWQLYDGLCAMYSEAESDELTWFSRRVRGDLRYRLKKEWYQNGVEVDFENIKINIPDGYDEVLKLKYGDYMTMRQVSGGHNYPFYKAQQEFLDKVGG